MEAPHAHRLTQLSSATLQLTLDFSFLFVFTPPDQIYCMISSSTTSKLAHHCQGGNKLEQSLIASRVNGRKWVGCGRKPHIPANCTNAQEANCQFDGMLSLSNWSWANWKNRQRPDRGGGVWEIASFEVGNWPFVDGKSLQAIGGRKGGGKKINGTLNHLLSRVLQRDEFLIAHSASCKWNRDYDSCY